MTKAQLEEKLALAEKSIELYKGQLAEMETYKGLYSDAGGVIGRLEGEVECLQERLDRANRQISIEIGKVDHLAAARNSLEISLESQKEANAHMSATIARQEEELAEERDKVARMEEWMDNSRRDREAQEKRLALMAAEISRLQGEEGRAMQAQASLDLQMSEKIARAEGRVSHLSRTINALHVAMNLMAKELKEKR